ncbi:kinesin-like protein KIF25 [Clarias gariepinus]|uniref:kinesin-like protein KIF25 n=1 Tax=Clarias gariepinus TaxID=13013 RepID=UPI00234C39E3|nr:kinesin-like protein KIF25 [Clarias gariepinus]
MPHMVNRDQILAHQVYLLEHKLRSKEERILELESENALLHLRLAECMGKLRRDHEEDVILPKRHCQHQGSAQEHPLVPLAKLLSHIQALKTDLRDVFAVYMDFAVELESQSKQLLEWMGIISRAVQGGDTQRLQTQVASLERSLQDEKERHRSERIRRKQIHNTLVELRGNIRVHCRVRPILPFDHSQGSLSSNGPSSLEVVVQAVSDDSVVVNCAKPGSPQVNKMFEFERVHAPEDSQDTVFEEVKPLLTSLLDGYNVCIMAYGQTGSGKTYTMIGSQDGNPTHLKQDPEEGIISKAAKELFKLISEKPAGRYTVEVSIVEVYNNELLDLLAKDEDGAAVGVRREVITTSAGTSEVPCLTYELVHRSADVMQLLGAVLRLRAHSPTLVHRDSSRSHLIVTLSVTSKSHSSQALAYKLRGPQKQWWSPRCSRAASSRSSSPGSSPQSSPCHSLSSPQEPLRTKLQLVDLAGSECAGTSGVSGAALWESSCINRSLSALSDVLGALAEQRPHVPYRNSKLTHLLQDSIGGDAKLLVMLCVSPTQHFLSETLQSLGFGYRARQIQRDARYRKNAGLKRK